jgi:catechol 2,3-dioxygenase-like lactoylglutathione lyase family enzyme
MSLQHVSLEVPPAGAEAEEAFWVLLGFAALEVPGGLVARARWVGRGGTQVHLLLTGDPAVPPQGHAAIVVDAFDAVCAALAQAGHPVEPRAEHWGVPRAFTRTPAGHRVELMAGPPPSRPAQPPASR